jgi:hypothetical protein
MATPTQIIDHMAGVPLSPDPTGLAFGTITSAMPTTPAEAIGYASDP